MYILLLGLVFLGLKVAGVEPVGSWPWWGVLAPFALAAAWWAFADATGYYKRREVRKMEQKAAAQRARSRDALKPERKSDRSR